MRGRTSRWSARSLQGPGLVAGLTAFLLWPAFASFPHVLLMPFAGALAVAGSCGALILLLTAIDFRNHRRGRQVRPIRAFDVAFGLALAVPSALELWVLLR